MSAVLRAVVILLLVGNIAIANDLRVTAPERAVQIRVEVLYSGGATLFDSDWKSGNILDVSDLPYGSYQLRISSRDLDGKLTEKQTTLHVSGDRITIDPALPEDLKLTTTAHDGTTGQLITTSGSLSFRFGDYLNHRDTEAMRLSPEGNLEVTGWIRAAQGILFSDGTLVDSKAAAEKKLKTKADASGTGTLNQISKWIDNVGTLGDSAVSEVSGNVGIGTMTPTGKLHIYGVATSDLYAGMGVDMNAGPAFNFGYGGASFGRSAGFFNVRPDGGATAPNPSLRFLTGNVERMIITNLGNIGIGTSTPGGKLQVFAAPTADVFAGFGTDMSAGPSLNFGYGGATFGRGAGFFNARPDASATAPNPSLRFMTANVERMIVTNGGNVGIGTSTPSEKLEIVGNLALPSTASGGTAGVISLGGARFIHNFGGPSNIFIGPGAGNFTTIGQRNTAVGGGTLANIAFANDNTAIGNLALSANTTGVLNTAIGRVALVNNTTGNNNIAVGVAGQNLTTGDNNIDIGNNGVASESNTIRIGTTGNQVRTFLAGVRDTTTSANDGQGVLIDSNGQLGTMGSVSFSNNVALPSTSGGGTAGVITFGGTRFIHDFGGNTFIGLGAGNFTTGGIRNVAVGDSALASLGPSLGTANDNTAIGSLALSANTTGDLNTAVGRVALINNTTGSNNIAIGVAGQNLTTGSNNIDIGNSGVTAESATIRIGANGTQTRFFVAGVRDVTTGVADGLTVLIDSSGQLGTISSSAQFKRDINDIGDSSALLKLRPVSFYYRNDTAGIRQYGLIAEEVARIMPELVQFSPAGEPQTVRYHFLAPLMLDEVQKQHQAIQLQQRRIEEQRKEISDLEERLRRLEALAQR